MFLNKKKILILITTICIYFILTYIYNYIMNMDKYSEIYILNRDVQRGEVIKSEYFNKISIKKESYLDYMLSIDDISSYVFKDNIYKDQILTKDIMLESSLYDSAALEVITIKFDSIEDIASYKVEKGSIVNIFYTAKTTDVKNLIDNIECSKTYAGENGFETVTIKLFENVEILNAYDKEGNISKINSKSNNIATSQTVSTIKIEVDKEKALIYNALKAKGKFSITILR